MPIPPRFQLESLPEELIAHMGRLCSEIEHALERGDEATTLLEEWHRHATRTCEPHEFTSYWKSTSLEEFVRDVLSPQPALVEDLTYAEARMVLEAVYQAELTESETSYFLHWLEEQFPGASMCDLIFWPDVWFGDASLFRDAGGAFKSEAELSLDQILGYAMKRSGRDLPGKPAETVLPFPLPNA